MNQMELNLILENHKKWLNDEEGGSRANLSGADLSGADLSDAYLNDANLRGANLRVANLSHANLSGADLSGADLSGANLRGANLRGAYLSDAYLNDAYLNDAYLSGANLRGAYLRGAYLRGATGNGSEIRSIQTEIWTIVYTSTVMQIGCERHDIADWIQFDNDKIANMDERALEWWAFWKPILISIFARQNISTEKKSEEVAA